MEDTCSPPEEWYVKINAHFVSLGVHLENGNNNGVGVLIRDTEGNKLWGAMGPMSGRTEVQALVWGIQSALIQCHLMGRFKVHIETTVRGVYDTIRRREDQEVAEDLVEAVKQFNTLYANNFVEGLTQWRASLIPNAMNGTAEYMALFGMQNMVSFAEAPGTFGELRSFLDRDMGLDLPFKLEDNFGLGEVIDASPPLSPIFQADSVEPDLGLGMHAYANDNRNALVIRNNQEVVSNYFVKFPESPLPPRDTNDDFPNSNESVNLTFNFNVNVTINVFAGSANYPEVFAEEPPPKDDEVIAKCQEEDVEFRKKALLKGKAKVLNNYAFNEDGLLSKAAIDIIDNGRFLFISKCFGKMVIDLEEEIFGGVYAKDVLDSVVRGTLDTLMSRVASSKGKAKGIRINGSQDMPVQFAEEDVNFQDDLMEVDDALMEWALLEQASLGLMG